MPRKAIPDETQNSVLLKSRRRCCLCFWLDGIDDVRSGQIAHLDDDNENADEENLIFLCLEHHDKYDSRTSQSKGLREAEVRKWRDELYKEMEYRFRTVRKRALSLAINAFVVFGAEDVREAGFELRFRLRNTGEVAVRTPTVSVGLPENVATTRDKFEDVGLGGRIRIPDLFAFDESREDFFEPNGRVGVVEPIRGANPVLIQDHSVEFDGLVFRFKDYPPGSEFTLNYRIDAEDMAPIVGVLQVAVPTEREGFVDAED
jgi:hypothetical protein